MTLAPLRKPLGRLKRSASRLVTLVLERVVVRPVRAVLRRLPISEATWAHQLYSWHLADEAGNSYGLSDDLFSKTLKR